MDHDKLVIKTSKAIIEELNLEKKKWEDFVDEYSEAFDLIEETIEPLLNLAHMLPSDISVYPAVMPSSPGLDL